MKKVYGTFNTAIKGSLEDLRGLSILVNEWVKEYPSFDEVSQMAEAIETELDMYSSESDDSEGVITFSVSTELSSAVLNFINDMAEAYPETETAVAAKVIYPQSNSAEYFAYYSEAGEETIFAAAEDPFSDENHVYADEDDWYEDDWKKEYEYERSILKGKDDYLTDIDWGFPEDAEWIPFGRE